MIQSRRLSLLVLCLYASFTVIIGRLFYWQILKGNSLQAVANNQYQTTLTLPGSRGKIYTADGQILVGNTVVYRLFAEPKLLSTDPSDIANQVLPILTETIAKQYQATDSAIIASLIDQENEKLVNKLNDKKNATWVGLFSKITSADKKKIEALQLTGLGFEPYQIRSYPEASMAAHLTGFVGKDKQGQDIGYFGIEGALEKELQPRSRTHRLNRDILSFTFSKNDKKYQPHDGRDVVLTIRRDIQHLVETHLEKGVEKYGAKRGEVIVYEPQTGKVLASATFPKYDQVKFSEYPQQLYKNPVVTEIFEPGSTFKVLIMAAGIENKIFTPETKCTECGGPVYIGKYTIRTWNDEYNPGITMAEALAKSDNTAMVFAQKKIGAELFENFLLKLWFGRSTTTDLQEDSDTPFPKKFGPVELANMSFGQGIGVTSMQLVRAVAAIANRGLMMQPQFIEMVVDPVSNQEIIIESVELDQVFSAETATQVTKMMVGAAENYGQRWDPNSKYSVAGKTGTSQIPIDGRYDQNKTIASYIAFSPAQNPRYLMYVKLVEPTTSPWGSATAAPLWYQISRELNLLLQISPDKY